MRQRKPIPMKLEGETFVCRFRHPLSKAIVRCPLGRESRAAHANLEILNRIWMDGALWHAPPPKCPPEILRAWYQGHGAPLPDADEATLRERVEYLEALVRTCENERDEEAIARRALEREVEFWKGSKIRNGPAPSLTEAREAFARTYTLFL